MTYKEFQKQNLDLSPIGLIQQGEHIPYFCTPRGARIIGSAGMDGIHYCFIRGFGEIVFTVSPMNEPGNYVHPIALSWDDLLRLLLACGNMAALEQAHGWSREQFDRFLVEYPPTAEQQAVLDAIREKTELEPLKDPYEYIHEVQAGFDYSALRFPPEYYDTVPDAPRPAWKVTFHGGFWSRDGETGREIPIGKTFSWSGHRWHVPAAYACPEGLVVDFCVEIQPEKIKKFLEKWYPTISGDPRLPRDVRRQVQAEDPMEIPHYHSVLTVDGVELKKGGSSGISWIPADCLPEDVEDRTEAEDLIAHYGLDHTRGWVFCRSRYCWDKALDVSALALSMGQLPQTIYGPSFPTPAVGDTIPFTHPVFGTEHTLTVTGLIPDIRADTGNVDADMEFPSHYSMFAYSLSPDLTGRQFAIRDTAESDEPRLAPGKSTFPGAASIGIIGGADGPAAIIFANRDDSSTHTACSSLHFEPVENVTWQMEFREKLAEDIQIILK